MSQHFSLWWVLRMLPLLKPCGGRFVFASASLSRRCWKNAKTACAELGFLRSCSTSKVWHPMWCQLQMYLWVDACGALGSIKQRCAVVAMVSFVLPLHLHPLLPPQQPPH